LLKEVKQNTIKFTHGLQVKGLRSEIEFNRSRDSLINHVNGLVETTFTSLIVVENSVLLLRVESKVVLVSQR